MVLVITSRTMRERTRGLAARAPLLGVLALALCTSPPAAAQVRISREPIQGLHGTIVAAVQGISGSGNEQRYQKYATRPNGFVLDRADLAYFRHNYDYVRLNLWHSTEDDHRAQLELSLPYPYTKLSIGETSDHFFLYPTEGESRRRDVPMSLQFESPASNWFLSIAHPYTRVTYGKSDRTPVDFSTRDALLQLTGSGAWGAADLLYGSLRLNNYTPEQPNHNTRTTTLRYARSLAGLAGITAEVEADRVRFANAAGQAAAGTAATSGRWSLRGYTSPLNPLSFTAAAQGTHQSRRVTQNAYARSTTTLSLTGNYRGLGKLNVQAGYYTKGIARLNATHAATDHPRWNTFWTKLSYNPLPRWSALLNIETRHLDGAPNVSLEDARPLWHNHQQLTDLRVLGSPTDNTELHLFLTSDRRRNTTRAVGYNRTMADVGGWIGFGRRLGLTGELTSESYSTNGVALAPYSIRANTAQLVLGWTASKTTNVDLGVSTYHTNGTETLREHALFLSARRRLPGNRNVGVQLRREVYKDRLDPQQSYTANSLWVTLGQQL